MTSNILSRFTSTDVVCQLIFATHRTAPRSTLDSKAACFDNLASRVVKRLRCTSRVERKHHQEDAMHCHALRCTVMHCACWCYSMRPKTWSDMEDLVLLGILKVNLYQLVLTLLELLHLGMLKPLRVFFQIAPVETRYDPKASQPPSHSSTHLSLLFSHIVSWLVFFATFSTHQNWLHMTSEKRKKL